MNPPKQSKVRKGTYTSKGGHISYVWEFGLNAVNEPCWRGTVKGVGLGTWDINGASLDGDHNYDLDLSTFKE